MEDWFCLIPVLQLDSSQKPWRDYHMLLVDIIFCRKEHYISLGGKPDQCLIWLPGSKWSIKRECMYLRLMFIPVWSHPSNSVWVQSYFIPSMQVLLIRSPFWIGCLPENLTISSSQRQIPYPKMFVFLFSFFYVLIKHLHAFKPRATSSCKRPPIQKHPNFSCQESYEGTSCKWPKPLSGVTFV